MKKVAIIGSGPGGYYTALRLSKLGCEVTLIEKSYAGGACLNVGCIPTKTLLDHTSLFEHFKESVLKKKLFSCNGISINQEYLRLYQLEVIKQLKEGLEKLFKNRNINFLIGEARLTSDKKIIVKCPGKVIEVETDDIVIATGSKPKSIPSFVFDNKYIVSSDDMWNIPNVPESLLVIGSGPIGIEFARVFNSLGSKVTISEIKESICPILDLEISSYLVRSLKKRGIDIKPNTASKFLEKTNGKVNVEFISAIDGKRENGKFDQVLIAVGRNPNTDNLGLEEVGIELLGGGFIKVNEYLQTRKGNVWAIGDVTNYPQLAHTASSQARVVSENILGKQAPFCGDIIPSCIFGYPEVAFVGQAEEALKEKKVSYKVGRFLFLASGKAKASGLTEGIVKILMDSNSKKILGAHIIGPEASNLIHELVVAMQNNLTVPQIASSIHIHPTYSEVVLEALEDCLGEAVHIL